MEMEINACPPAPLSFFWYHLLFSLFSLFSLSHFLFSSSLVSFLIPFFSNSRLPCDTKDKERQTTGCYSWKISLYSFSFLVLLRLSNYSLRQNKEKKKVVSDKLSRNIRHMAKKKKTRLSVERQEEKDLWYRRKWLPTKGLIEKKRKKLGHHHCCYVVGRFFFPFSSFGQNVFHGTK